MILLLLNFWLLNVYFLAMKLVTHWSHWLTSKLLTIYSLMKWLCRLFIISCKSSFWLWSKRSQFENSMIIMLKTHYSCHLFKSDYSRSYDWHSFYVDHLIKSTSNDSQKNMNEQNQSNNWYANRFSSIFEFQFY